MTDSSSYLHVEGTPTPASPITAAETPQTDLVSSTRDYLRALGLSHRKLTRKHRGRQAGAFGQGPEARAIMRARDQAKHDAIIAQQLPEVAAPVAPLEALVANAEAP